MSTSLRDQLLKAGLISKKQANEAERQSERQSQQHRQHAPRPPHAKQKHDDRQVAPPPASRPSSGPSPAPRSSSAPRPAQSTGTAAAKLLRDRELNRRQQAKAEAKARMAQIKQLIEQNRLGLNPGEGAPGAEATVAVSSAPVVSPATQFYNFVDGEKIRRIAVDDHLRDRLIRGDVVIVKFNARYELVPAAIAGRIGERDPSCILAAAVQPGSAPTEPAYERFVVPDDLIW
jgi:uncharacterized protein YaiL (DUF2058 family)